MQQSRRSRRFGKYELLAQIGAGGMAQVHLARMSGPMNFEKVVVVKTIHPELSSDREFLHMLLDEARISALIRHPRVIDIYDLGEVDGAYFIAMSTSKASRCRRSWPSAGVATGSTRARSRASSPTPPAGCTPRTSSRAPPASRSTWCTAM